MRPENVTAGQREAFSALQPEDLKVGPAWALKERFCTFWEYRYPRLLVPENVILKSFSSRNSGVASLSTRFLRPVLEKTDHSPTLA
jgi:hypothetical protein